VPTYQYACTVCGHQLEAVQSFTDDPLTQCPACEGRLRKLFGSVGVVFKGPGFYRTDSRASLNGAGKKSEKSDAKSDSGSGDKSTGKSGGDTGGDTGGDSAGTTGGDGAGGSTNAKNEMAAAGTTT
jgi:putative FmdB family regulatory protein